MIWVWFAVAAGLGGFIRYSLEHRMQPIGKTGFPRATLYVNVAGSFLLGLVIAAPDSIHTIIGIAFCGSLTTFSGVSAQLMRRVTTGAIGSALNYLAITLTLGLIAAEIGIKLSELLFN
jgi:CrcB protein